MTTNTNNGTTMQTSLSVEQQEQELSSSSLPNDLGIVATKIHERAQQLVMERQTLQHAKDELQNLKVLLQEETKKTMAVRRELLQTERQRHGIELELMNVRDEYNNLQEEIHRTECQTQEKIQCTQKEQESFQTNTMETIMVPHMVKRKLFQTHVECKIQHFQNQKLQREEYVNKIKEQIQQIQQEISDSERDIQHYQTQIKLLQEEQIKNDDEATNIANEIKALIAKRTSLRDAIQDSKETNRKLQEEMEMVES